MHLLDITMFYASESGGVKRYLSAKQDWLRHHTSVRHSLLVPGEYDSEDAAGILTCASPAIPFTGGYRWPLHRARFMRRIVDLSPDVVEAGDPYGLAWTALEAGQRLGIPVVGFYHSDLARLVSRRVGAWCEPAAARYIQRLYRRFDLVLAPSRIMAEKLRAFGVGRVEQQTLGVDIRLFNPSRRDHGLRRELGLAHDTRLLIYAGRIAREKNLPILMDAMRRLGPGYHLLVVGGGTRPRLLSNVIFYPFLASAQDLARLLASSDALVHAGDQETFGLVVLEAMACGLPVIGVEAGAVPELIDADTGLLARPRDAASLAEAIAALYERDLAAVGHAARRRVERVYSWDRVFRRQLLLYERLLAGRRVSTDASVRACG